MTNVITHPITKSQIRTALNSNAQSIGLIGPPGAGKSHLALSIAHKIIGTRQVKFSVISIEADNSSITIDQIRRLQSVLKLRVPGTRRIRRMAIIHDSQLMTIEAQNALLKILEEPPEDTLIILTITSRAKLLPTILSRLLTITVLPLPRKDCIDFAKRAGGISKETERAWLISGGYAGLFLSLVTDLDNPVSSAINDAKLLLSLTKYERLNLLATFAKEKTRLELTLLGVRKVLSAAARTANSTKDQLSIARRLEYTYRAEEDLASNPNIKLLLTDLALNL